MSSRGARTARGLVAALLAVFVAAFSHVASGGQTPGLLATVLSLAFAVPACVVLAGRRMSLWRMSLSVVMSQAVFHALFSLHSDGPRVLAMPAGAHEGHLHLGEHLAVSAAPETASAMSMTPTPLMLAGHLLAAVVTIVALRRGEGALVRMLALAAIRVVRAVRVLTPAPLPRPVAVPFEAPLAPRERLARIGRLRHRGPPAALAFA